MSSSAILVLADDLTGAAEIAAISHDHGVASGVRTLNCTGISDTLSEVWDTDSRLSTQSRAVAKITQLAQRVARSEHNLCFKKVDSVLRGHVVAETLALAQTWGFRRVLLVSANPSLHRTQRAGQIEIAGTPLDQTEFQHDPHHPASSSFAADLLVQRGGMITPVILDCTQSLPSSGFIVGNAASLAEVDAWAAQLTPDTLAAGGADFFRALLRHRGYLPRPPSPVANGAGPVLLLSGSTSAGSQRARTLCDQRGWAHASMPFALVRESSGPFDVFNAWLQLILTGLEQDGFAFASAPPARLETVAASEAIRQGLAKLAQALHQQGKFRHLVVEGGATAAAILSTLNWDRLDVFSNWAPGVITLRPRAAPHLLCTLKPGSYRWPENLLSYLASNATQTS